jgi:hypothetical protein
VVALAAVQATGDPETARAVLDVAAHPDTPFESFHALRALESLRQPPESGVHIPKSRVDLGSARSTSR